MIRSSSLLVLLVMSAGCISHGTETVPSNVFGNPAAAGPPVRRVNFAQADTTVSMRVDAMGRKILAANPQIGMQPVCVTIGDPKPEIFHQETHFVYLTAGLVGMCKTDAELAAVLSQELGKMVSEREARTSAATREAAGLLPVECIVGQGGGYGAAPDMTHMAEMARHEKKYPRRPLPPPDPRFLAQNYLEKAGYARAEVDHVIPLLDAAEKNSAWEAQINGRSRQRNWTP
jgi:predicted Zn-dependent protease